MKKDILKYVTSTNDDFVAPSFKFKDSKEKSRENRKIANVHFLIFMLSQISIKSSLIQKIRECE